MSQPTVSGHLKVLRNAGLVQPRRAGGRTVFVGSRKRIERLLEDARSTIASRPKARTTKWQRSVTRWRI